MQKGIYIALSGAVLKHTQMEIISQNLANADTTGYKKDIVAFQDYLLPQDLISPKPDERVMSTISSFSTDFSSGNLLKSGNPLDVAIEGTGFIALEGNHYTRRGDLKKSKEGYLTTHAGAKVLGNKGPILLPEGQIQVTEAGQVSVNGLLIDSIKIVEFKDTDTLSKMGESAFTGSERGTQSKSLLKQGYLERSNVDVIKEMVRMIDTLREFETFQKAIQTFDEAAGKVNNEIGRL